MALLVSNGTGAVLGVVFWAVATHLFTTAQIGDGAAEIAAMTLLATIAQLNLSVIFPRFLFAAGARAPLVLRSGYFASAMLALVAAVIFLTVTGHHPYISRGILSAAVFLAAVLLWVVFTIEDAALIGLRKTFWVPVENTSFSMAKIILLPVFAVVTPAAGVFYSWTLPVIACVIPVNYYLFRKVLPAHVALSGGRASIPSHRVVGTVLAGEYIGGMAFMVVNAVPALLIVGRLGATKTAYFQTPWLVGMAFDMLLFSIATSLLVEASARPHAAPALVRRAVRLASLLLLPGFVVLVAGAPLILSVLGRSYADHGTTLLRWLAVALPFMGINALYLTYARLARRIRRVVAVQVGLAALVISMTAVLIPHLGIAGAGVAFTASQALFAGALLPSVVRQYRRTDMAPGFAGDAPLVVREFDGAVEAPSRLDDEVERTEPDLGLP
jgi:O-antigen/teichoic acid export membrane protein